MYIRQWDIDGRFDYTGQIDDDELLLRELLAFKACGGQTIVDLTVRGIGRAPMRVRALAEQSGLTFVVGCGLSAFAVVTFFLARLATTDAMKGILKPTHLRDLGNLMLAFVMFYAYTTFSEFLLIWYANIPEETQFFITRNTESWWALSMLLVVGRFFISFAILLLRSIKKEPRHLCWIAGWIVCMQMLDIYIIVLPALHGTGVHVSIWDLLSLIAIGATLGFVYLRIVPRTSLFPVRDPRLIESLNLVN